MTDYYAILGVLPTAEEVVIKAAYRALAQRYHPDRFDGSEEEANRRMAELNAAYEVLSDKAKRAAYDESRAAAGPTFSEFAEPGAQSTEDDLIGAMEADWTLACEYFPDLKEIQANLGKVAHRLAATYQLYLLETKKFGERKEVAQQMERLFLERYFGTNREIIEFARWQVMQGNKEALRELNAAIRVLGSSVDPKVIITKLVKDYGASVRQPVTFTERDRARAEHYWPQFRRAICDNDLGTVVALIAEAPALVVLNYASDGNTALHLAVNEGRPEVVDALLNAGADPHATNNFGTTPISHIRTQHRAVMLQIFRRYAADVPTE